MRYTVLYVGFGRILRRETSDTETPGQGGASPGVSTTAPYDDHLFRVQGRDQGAQALALVLREVSQDREGELQSAGRLVTISAESAASRVSRQQADAAAEEILAARPALAITPLPGLAGPEIIPASSPLLDAAKAVAARLLLEPMPT